MFHAGFLTGGPFFDYRKPDPKNPDDKRLFEWRAKFMALCRRHGVSPAAACVRFAMSPPGVVSISLNTSKPERVEENAALVQAEVPARFWTALKDEGLVAKDYPYLG